MSGPYGTIIQFYLDGTETTIFHECAGLEAAPREGDVIYLNAVGYKVESSTLYLTDQEYTNPESGVDEWAMSEVRYKVYMSVLP